MAKNSASTEAKSTRSPSKEQGNSKYAICVPSSIISLRNARNLEQITNIAYQIARAATIFNVSEIVILESPSVTEKQALNEAKNQKAVEVEGTGGNKKISFNLSDADIGDKTEAQNDAATQEVVEKGDNESNGLLFATLLQFFVTPPYLVKGVFQDSIFKHKFKYAEKLPKLTTLPFMNNNNVIKDFKEGLSIPKHTPKIKKKNKKVSALKKLQVTKYINIGQTKPLELNGAEIPVNVRVTVDVKNKKVVSPQVAYGVTGTKASFGYFVRYAKSFSSIFTELSFPEGYTESIFVRADDYFNSKKVDLPKISGTSTGQKLLVVSSLEDLNYIFEGENIPGVQNATEMFDGQLEVPEGLRIEDAVMIGLTRAQQL